MCPIHQITASVYAFCPRENNPASFSAIDAARKIANSGFGLEIFLSDYDFVPFTPGDLDKLRGICSAVEIVTAHTNQFSWNHDALVSEIGVAKSLGVSIMVVHPGTFGFEKCDNPPSAATLKDICKHALDNGIHLAFENSGRTGMAMMTRAMDILGSDPDASGLGICIDTGHANRSIPVDGFPSEEYIRRFSDAIIELHINDNLGGEDLHLAPGQGTVNWPAVTDAIRLLPRQTALCLELARPEDSKPLDALARSKEFLITGLDHSLK